jgi:RNA polymerase sigma-70 factor (ECF subfamily)
LGLKLKDIHQDIIRRCRENDKEAQFEIYKFYFKTMYNTSLRILNNTADAEDVMQDSFLDAFGKIDSFSGEGNFGGWLRRIVVNNSIDALKKKHNDLEFDEVHMDIVEEKDNTVEETTFKVEEIKKAVKTLKEDTRVIISLFLFEGYDHEEISQILNISYNSSRTRYSRARKKLLKVLADQRNLVLFHPN